MALIEQLIQGMTVVQIAKSLSRPVRTVEGQILSLKNKTGCAKKPDLIGWFINNLYQIKPIERKEELTETK